MPDKEFIVRKSFKALLVCVLTIIFLSACGASHEDSKPAAPKTLIGDWHQTKSGIPNAVMSAKISADHTIQINLKMGDTSGIYWLGTFNISEDLSKPFKTVSQGDQDAMQLQIYASSEKNKTFRYKDGDLSYEFSILGVSTTVHLSKGEART